MYVHRIIFLFSSSFRVAAQVSSQLDFFKFNMLKLILLESFCLRNIVKFHFSFWYLEGLNEIP
jgi:hypothetical protein